ncbi:MAG TPA: SBBP repeat-containing protein, partial [Bacteroidia bacterium]|nr:SBBP repeat-containing protein [Bacteroidia bacterium]
MFKKSKIIFLSAFLMLPAFFLRAQTLYWSVTYNGSQNAWDESRLLYVDASGNSYFGAYETTATNNDVAIFKYDALGNQLWKAGYNGGWNGIDWANAMAVDASGNLYVTGYVTDPLGTAMVIKFNSSGVYQWIAYFSSTSSDEGAAIVTDGTYVYATSSDFVFSHFNNDYITIKLDCSTGTLQTGWPQWFNGAANNYDVPTGIAIDNSSNVYVTGYSTNSSGNKDIATVAYTTGGVAIAGWPAVYNGSGNGDDVPAQILVKGATIYVTGYCTGSGTNWDMFTTAYTSAGA